MSRTKIVLLSVGAILILIVVMIASTFGHWGWQFWTAEVKGKVEARQDIMSGENRIARYNWFFDTCAEIQALEYQIDDQYITLELFDKGSREYNETITRLNGQKAHRAKLIAQYNADANKNYTWGQFRSSDLPWELPVEPYQKGKEKLKCKCVYEECTSQPTSL